MAVGGGYEFLNRRWGLPRLNGFGLLSVEWVRQ